MIGVLVVTHGALADELIGAARMIAGELAGFRALSLDWKVGLEEARSRIATAAARLDMGDGVLILTDMFGDTPFNAAVGLRRAGKIEVVSGVNLPMVVRLGCTQGTGDTLAAAAEAVALKGRRAICRAGAADPDVWDDDG